MTTRADIGGLRHHRRPKLSSGPRRRVELGTIGLCVGDALLQHLGKLLPLRIAFGKQLCIGIDLPGRLPVTRFDQHGAPWSSRSPRIYAAQRRCSSTLASALPIPRGSDRAMRRVGAVDPGSEAERHGFPLPFKGGLENFGVRRRQVCRSAAG